MVAEWKTIKQVGSRHYKSGVEEVEPIDLYYSLGILPHFAVASIIKYAVRSIKKRPDPVDCAKIRHFASMLEFMSKWGPVPIAATSATLVATPDA